jgi:hypothetical protein
VDEAKQLRGRIASSATNVRGHRLYGPELRRDLQAFVRQNLAQGGSAKTIAKSLGLNAATLISWLKKERATAMRRVDAVPDAPMRSHRDLVIEIGSDLRVAGLSLEQAVELVRRLR